MKEQLERDIEVLRKIERLLNEELSEDTFNEYNFLTEWEEFKLAKSDLEFRLESLEAKEKEVSIWDVIEECKGVVDKEGMTAILSKYEVKYRSKEYWNELVNNVQAITNPIGFIAKGHQLRLKGRK